MEIIRGTTRKTMIHQNESKLDNPVWHSLSEVHQKFAVDYDGIKFYHPDYCPFGGFCNNGKYFEAH